MQLEHLTLDTLARGGAQEKFDYVLAEVLANIRDPNTDHKKKRQIVITIDVLPEENRAEAKLVTNVVPKLAPSKPVISTIFFGVKEGQMQAAEIVQDELFPTPKEEKKMSVVNKEGK